MNNIVSKIYSQTVVIAKDWSIFHGMAYTTQIEMNPDSVFVMLINGQKHVFKLKDIASIAIKIPNKQCYNLYYKGEAYSVNANNELFNSVDDLFNGR